MNEEYLKLFTPVSEGLPVDGKPVIWIIEYQNWSTAMLFGSKNDSIPKSQHSPYTPYYKRTHWLDLSKLNKMLFDPEIHTTKEKAMDFARNTYLEGSRSSSLLGALDYMKKNQYIL